MERITKEIRNGTIDYEEYYNQNLFKNRFPGSYDVVKNSTYAQDYCQYSLQFYTPGNDGEIGTADDVSTGKLAEGVTPAIGKIVDNVAVPDPVQSGLYLININGDHRTYIQRTEKTDPISKEKIGSIGLLKLVGEDYGIDHIDASGDGPACKPDPGENDGRIDTWLCEDGFPCQSNNVTVDACTGRADTITYDPLKPADNSFLDITPDSLDIVDLKFFVSPMDDPRKAYNTDEIQIQPSVTIRLTARANPRLAMQFENGKVPSIVLESTVSARAYNEIITECNLKQCFPETKKDCPLSAGVCLGAKQTCDTSFLWSGCTKEKYLENSPDYEEGTEFASCDALPVNQIFDCKKNRCSDDKDNDCNGLTDAEDPNCKFWLCNNGIRDPKVGSTTGEYLEDCIDVGGICQQIRPYEAGQETYCTDDHDNDCDGLADEFDPDCIKQICNNGIKDSGDPALFVNFMTYHGSPNYLVGATTDPDLNEKAIDVGGICQAYVDLTSDKNGDGVPEGIITGYYPIPAVPPAGSVLLILNAKKETGTEFASCGTNTACKNSRCSDGLDNDGDGSADEFDSDCIEVICTNGVKNCDMVPSDYTPKDYLGDYTDNTCGNPGLSVTDEYCTDVGGICDNFREVISAKYFDHKKIDSENKAKLLTPTTGTCTSENCPLTSAANLCNDGLDNDCDGKIDWQDPDCCQDADGDGFIAKSDTCNPPPLSEGGPVLDCNDDPVTGGLIYPGAPEICDPENPNIDNNCSFINGLTTSVSDYTDPKCCVDTDEDKYGVAQAYIGPLCTGGKPDCNDTNPLVHPDQIETGDIMCFNEKDGKPVNDDCNTIEIDDPGNPGNKIPVNRANNIDWYSDKDSNWFKTYLGFSSYSKSGITAAKELNLFEPACCDLTAIEICDDVFNSDENCNGLEGTNDNYCVFDVAGLKKGFFDNLTTNAYISLDPGLVQNSETGTVTLAMPTNKGNVTSSSLSSILNLASCTGSYRVLFSPIPTVEIPPGTTIRFQLSGDGGAHWCGNAGCTTEDALDKGNDEYWIDMTEIATAHVDFTNPDYQLRWRAELTGDTASKVPVLDNVTINFSCL